MKKPHLLISLYLIENLSKLVCSPTSHTNICMLCVLRSISQNGWGEQTHSCGHACKSKPSTACDEVRCRGINRVCRYHGSHFHLAGRDGEKHKEPPKQGGSDGQTDRQAGRETDRQTDTSSPSATFKSLSDHSEPLRQLPLSGK